MASTFTIIPSPLGAAHPAPGADQHAAYVAAVARWAGDACSELARASDGSVHSAISSRTWTAACKIVQRVEDALHQAIDHMKEGYEQERPSTFFLDPNSGLFEEGLTILPQSDFTVDALHYQALGFWMIADTIESCRASYIANIAPASKPAVAEPA